ncbi:MAG: hypothetical protein HY820_30035 [Acidobacteria bacterium]|nr:hypothetical protein [Acidobacteriota bacterium]
MAAFVVSVMVAQSPQNPSPMVEHRREHPRLSKAGPPGRRDPLSVGTLFAPKGARIRNGMPLLVFFHGGTWLPEVAAAQRKAAVLHVQIGAGSGVYGRAFAEPARFRQWIGEAETKWGVKFGRVSLGGWSAGNGAIRAILRDAASYDRVAAVISIDGIHTDYVTGKPGPQESDLAPAHLEYWLQYARDAMAGRKQLLIAHTEIFPGTYASTTETADWLIKELGLKARPVLRWGPMRTQQLSEAKRGKFELRGYAGNSAPDHVDLLHSLPAYWKKVR